MITSARMKIAGVTVAAVAVLAVTLVGCGNSTTTTSPTTSPTTAISVTTSTTTATSRPSSPLSPEGFGAKPPTPEQIQELGAWIDGPGAGARRALDDVGSGWERMNAADSIAQMVNACQSVTDSLTLRLPAALPSPDPDTTKALTFLIEDGEMLAAACSRVGSDNPTEADLDAVEAAIHQLGQDLQTTGTIMNRNGDLLASAAKALDPIGSPMP